ncbi:MAG TPA: hypothetical protein VIL32_11520 [Steroidobacteraceae bacterium]
MSLYIVIAVRYEERDLVRHFGADYREYQQRAPKFLRRCGAAHAPVAPYRAARPATPVLQASRSSHPRRSTRSLLC